MPVLTKEEIKQSVKMTDLLDRYGIKHIKNKALCPFHDEKSPSFTVRGIMFHCFGCGAGGDIFKFTQQMENCDFKTALKLLGGGEDGQRPRIPKPTEEQRKQKRKEQIVREWLKCLNYVRANAPPVLEIDLTILNDRAMNNLCAVNPEYIRQLHRLPYLEYLVFEGADT